MQTFVKVMLLGMILLLMSACDQTQPEPTPTGTPEATPLVENVSLSGEYFLTISTVTDEFLPENTPTAPAGFKWVLITASITNTTGPAITVAEDSLYVVDEKGERYVVEKPDEAVNPPLAGAVVPSSEGVMGLMRFAIPEDATPTKLEWCMDTACEERLAIDIPQS